MLQAVLIALLLLSTNIVTLPFLPGGRMPLAGQLGAIYTVVFLASLCTQFFGPARMALIGDIVSEQHQAQASSMTQVARSLAMIIALSFVCSFLLLLAMRTPQAASSREPGESPHALRELVAGLRFSMQNRVVLTLAGMLAQRIGLVRMLTGSLLVAGIDILIYSRLTSFVPALIVVTLTGVFMAALNVAAGPLILRVTPRAYIGRVFATIEPTSALMQVLGTVLAGYLASTVLLNLHVQVLGMAFGPIDTIFTAGAVLILLGAAYAILRLGFTDPQSCVDNAPAAVPSELMIPVVSE